MSKSANLQLELTGTSSADTSQSFATWRQKINGEASDSNMNIIDAAVKDLQDRVGDLAYVEMAINTFTVNPASAEKGSTVASLSFAYTLNKVPTLLKFENETLANAQTGTKSLTGQSITTNTSWTLTAKDSGSPSHSAKQVTKTATLTFMSKIYYGAASAPGTINSAFLLGLSNSELATSRAKTFTVNAGSGKYIWYAVPTSFGACSFNVGGFDGGFEPATTISHTNASGYTENYYVYRSTNANLGNTTVKVS